MTDAPPSEKPQKKRAAKVTRPAWWGLLKRNSEGAPYANELNVMIALESSTEFAGALLYDEFADQIRIVRPLPWYIDPLFGPPDDFGTPAWRENDRIELQVWLQLQGLMVSKSSVVQDAVIATAKRHGVHPVRAFLKTMGQVWDGKPRLDHWLIDYLGACDNGQYLKAIGPAFFIGAVARVMSPGCQMDTILVLESPQGGKKTSVVRALSNGWYSDLSHDLTSKDAAILIQGVWICEMSELTALARSKVEEVKAFISRNKDRYRPPYARNAEDRLRQTVFIATTNEVEYLQDPTGARRFWPVDCRAIDLEALKRDLYFLWGEAVVRHSRGEPWHLPKSLEPYAFREQQHRRRISPLETAVLGFADRQRKAAVTIIDMRTVLREALNLDPIAVGPAAGAVARDVSRVLTANGWVRKRPRGRGQSRIVEYEYRTDRDPEHVMEIDPGSQDASQAPKNEGSSL